MAPFSRSPVMQHIDRKSLYTSLEARIRYLHSFLDFGANDVEALTSGSKYIQALIPAVVNIVYKKLLQYDITARAFQTRSTAFEGPMDDVPDEDSPQILHRKMFLRAYLKKLCTDPTQMEFWEYLDKVGMMHTGIGRTYPLHIEYIHIGAGLAVIQDVLTEAILSHPRLHLARKIALVKALGKVIWIQNDLFTKWYVHDGEEFTDGMDFGVIEKEGWLHGKKVLDDEAATATASESEASDDTATGSPAARESKSSGALAKGVCPFTGMAASMGDLKVSDDKGGGAPPKAETARASE
ncbi:Protoglobin-domain-containing protein [Lasiosphaeria miniovina]|uniref:Protoglobin-domain-containing protein n=1 Tax=Lasiosphaeria miniovina TaxID=1954250 RepID=A0AA40DXS1_9PEZI|nr:Protoglobin-domain-containing protein [Lasiosphaeria miniovina]KAK0716946.1 Protoglobin-domain-containing protein [Lasiosphaeria miniovina]